MRYLLAIFLISGITYFITRNYLSPVSKRAAVLPPAQAYLPPVQTAAAEAESPDGTMKLLLESNNKNRISSYQLISETVDSKDRQFIYATDSARGELSLSFNSWSPDNKYAFVLQKINSKINGLVFKIDTNKESIQPITVSKENLREITGWDSPEFMHVRTISGDKKTAYWFDVNSQGFIQIATY